MTTAYVRTSENKWEQVRTSGQSVGHCGQNYPSSTPATKTSKQEVIKSTTIPGAKHHADSTQLGFFHQIILVKRHTYNDHSYFRSKFGSILN